MMLLLSSDLTNGDAGAALEQGVLTVRLPKAEEVRPKSIKVKPKQTSQSK